MRAWKKRWKEELDKVIPELRDDVRKAAIPVSEHSEYNGGNTAVLSRGKQRIVIIAAVAAVFLCAVILCLGLLLSGKKNAFLFTVEINPTVSMAAEENGKVTGVIACNADADVILSAEGVEENIVGKNIEDAITYYTDYAVKLGYLNVSESGSAVRISECGSAGTGELLDKTKSALETYFMRKGIFAVVICEIVSEEEYGLRSGVSLGQSVEEMARFINESKVLFSEREAEGLPLEELQEIYGGAVLSDAYFGTVKSMINDNLERLAKNADDIQNLCSLYWEIYAHEDNPATLLRDYWYVKKYYGGTLSGEFATLMEEMEDALLRFRDDYGWEITGIDDLRGAANGYLSVPVETIAALLENISLNELEEYSSAIVKIMEAAGIASEDICELMELPRTIEEYYRKSLLLLSVEYQQRLDAYEDIYNRAREPLSEEEYLNYIADILAEYDSLNAYWQEIRN